MCGKMQEIENAGLRFTVFTPAYNRGCMIEKLYQSLRRQSFRNFEWVVVDDGSQDDTEQRFQRILSQENDFPVRYFKTENGGKHRAINYGLQRAGGELFFIVDSDDYLKDNALEAADRVVKSIPPEEKGQFAGICGSCCLEDGTVIGTEPEAPWQDLTSLQRDRYGIEGDKAEIFYTELLRKYPFPTFEGERFLTESVVWDRIAADGGMLRFFPECLKVCEYREDGLSAHIAELHLRNPRGYGLYLSQSEKLGRLKGLYKWNTFLDYYYGVREKLPFREIGEILHKNPTCLWIIFFFLRIYHKLVDQ